MTQYDTLIVEWPAARVVRVTLNRPEVLNALNTRMGIELRTAFGTVSERVGTDEVRAVILTGAGERAFCAGADLKERDEMTDDEWQQQHLIFEAAVEAVAGMSVPVVAAVNGVALGGGCELTLACDFIIAADTSRFGQPEVSRGIMPGLGATQRLPRRIGPARAKEFMFTARVLEAGEALDWGLVNRIVPPGGLADEALATARLVAQQAPIAVRGVKWAVDDGQGLPLGEALGIELEHYRIVAATEDRREGVRAFNEGRPPVFRNR